MQAMLHYTTGQTLSTCFTKVRVHDFRIFKQSMRFLHFKPFIMDDKCYVGLAKTWLVSLLHFNAVSGKMLDSYLKRLNGEINRRWIIVGHKFRALKRFKILSLLYRNRRSRLGLRFNLIAATFNFEKVQIWLMKKVY